MAIVYLGLGSNVGDRLSNMRNAAALLSARVERMRASLVYETIPMGYEKQGDFLNAAVMGETGLEPEELLLFVRDVERKVGRVHRLRWGPREIDIDILMYGDLVYRSGNLEIPHPRMHERDFVLRPLMDLAPGAIHPLYKKTVRQLYGDLGGGKAHIIGAGKDLLS